MNVQSINNISTIDLSTIYKVLSSSSIPERQKENFIFQHRAQIHVLFRQHLNGAEYKYIMKNRPLRKFRFIKNSLTKRGDRILLANTLEINPAELDDYIENVENSLFEDDILSRIPKDKLEAIKTYVYRHGSRDDLVNFLDYELKSAKNVLDTLYETLDYHKGGVADYFIRPVHRMSNKTMVKLYDVIYKHIKSAEESGAITEERSDEVARWALIQIYNIQNNSKLINAIKTYKTLKE